MHSYESLYPLLPLGCSGGQFDGWIHGGLLSLYNNWPPDPIRNTLRVDLYKMDWSLNGKPPTLLLYVEKKKTLKRKSDRQRGIRNSINWGYYNNYTKARF